MAKGGMMQRMSNSRIAGRNRSTVAPPPVIANIPGSVYNGIRNGIDKHVCERWHRILLALGLSTR